MRCVVLFVASITPLLTIYRGRCQGKKLVPRVVQLYEVIARQANKVTYSLFQHGLH
jgi:hypothetical protein